MKFFINCSSYVISFCRIQTGHKYKVKLTQQAKHFKTSCQNCQAWFEARGSIELSSLKQLQDYNGMRNCVKLCYTHWKILLYMLITT